MTLREETDSSSPIRCVDIGYERRVGEVSKRDGNLIENGLSERKRERGTRFSDEEWGCACWRNNAEIEIDLDLVWEKDDAWIGHNLEKKNFGLLFEKRVLM